MVPNKFWGMLFVVGIGCIAAACTSTGRNYVESSMQETLDIEILPNTSKMFVYRLRWPEGSSNDIHVARGATFQREGRSRGGVELNRSSEQRLRENAAYVVNDMGYCREGILVIDSSLSQFHLWVKGECKEGATEEDRKKFGEKQTLPVKVSK